MVQPVLRDRIRIATRDFERPKPRQRWQLSSALAMAVVAIGWITWAPLALAAGTVSVLYAGSLVNLMERGIGPAFDKASGDQFRGYAGGSKLLANQIKDKLRQGDVFISANPAVNDSLMGPANGEWVSWYVSFAQSPLVLGYNPTSRFAADFKSKPWYQVLTEPGMRVGRTDPKLDPKTLRRARCPRRVGRRDKSPAGRQATAAAPGHAASLALIDERADLRRHSGRGSRKNRFFNVEPVLGHHTLTLRTEQKADEADRTLRVGRAAQDCCGIDRFRGDLRRRPDLGNLRAGGLGRVKESDIELA
jgi:hypothetical protein